MPRMRAFLLSFFLTAGILAPLVLFLLLLQGRQQQRQAQVDAPASGVPIALPGPDDALTCLAVVRTQEEDWFLLLRLDAYNNTVTSLGLPGQTAVRSPEGGAVTLAEACTGAGPGRAAALLADTLGVEISHYLLGDQEDLAQAAAQLFAPATVNLSGYDVPGAQAQVGKAPVQAIAADQAAALLAEWDLDADQQAGMLANIAGELLLAAIQTDGTLPGQLLRDTSSGLLTTLTSAEFASIDRICGFLSTRQPELQTRRLPGRMAGARFELDEEAPALAARLLGSKEAIDPESGADSASDSASAFAPEASASPSPSAQPEE